MIESTSITALQLGSDAAYRLLVYQYHGKLVAFINKLIQDEDRAKDIAQDVYITLYEKRHLLQAEGNLNALIFTIAQRKVFDVLRKRKRGAAEISLQETEGLIASISLAVEKDEDTSFLLEEMEVNLRPLLHKLPRKQRQIFMLRLEEQLSTQQIAERLTLSPSTVKGQLGKAIKKLQQLLRSQELISIQSWLLSIFV